MDLHKNLKVNRIDRLLRPGSAQVAVRKKNKDNLILSVSRIE